MDEHMNTKGEQQERMLAAFDNYFSVSDTLRDDLNALLSSERESQRARRNFVRVSAALIEGYTHCFREMCAVALACIEDESNTNEPKTPPTEIISTKLKEHERKALSAEEKLEGNERIKYTLRAAYKLFQLQPGPNFGGAEWQRAQQVLRKRHALMHPKTPADLEISDDLWDELQGDVTWLVEQLFNFMSALHAKHAS